MEEHDALGDEQVGELVRLAVARVDGSPVRNARGPTYGMPSISSSTAVSVAVVAVTS